MPHHKSGRESVRLSAPTILQAVAEDATPKDIQQPGHVFPLVAKPGGVLKQAGHTEAGVDLAHGRAGACGRSSWRS